MKHTYPQNITSLKMPPGRGLLGVIFAGYLPLTSQKPNPIIVYFMANYRTHDSHF